jgi:hypothetical protein
MKLYSYFSLVTKINSKQIKELNVRPETMKLLEEKRGNAQGIGMGENFFLIRAPKHRKSNPEIDRGISFCTAKETMNTVKR